MNETARHLNRIAETHQRVQCSKGHWTLARLVYDFATRTQRTESVKCGTCREEIK